MFARLLSIALLVAVLAVSMTPSSVSAALPGPPGDSLKACMMNGNVYPHGAIYVSNVYFNRTLIYSDVYKCQDGKWVYLYSKPTP